MKLDSVKRKALEDIKQELEKEGVLLGIEELANIASFPFVVANFAFKKKLDICIPVFGKFLHVPKMEIGKTKLALKQEYEEGTKEYKEAVLKAQKSFKARAKARANTLPMTLEEIKKVPDIIEISNKIDKINE